jgi:ribosome biogenesis GTPase / thiamine phosphate phosphatase
MKRRKNNHQSKDPTEDYLSGKLDDDRVGGRQQFNRRSKFNQQMKTERTTRRRVEDDAGDIDQLPVGRVIQVFSLFCEVEWDGTSRLCVVRKTLHRVSDTSVVVGDRVRVRTGPTLNAGAQAEGVIERIEPRQTVLTRADSFKGQQNHPIVANADQMLIVAAIVQPDIRWGLIDRMLIAAQSGLMKPILALNKMDLADEAVIIEARSRLDHFRSLGIDCIETSVNTGLGMDELRRRLAGRLTVLAGHSGVGKSSLGRSIDPKLDLKVGEISSIHLKGKHTTTSARIFPLAGGGEIIDTPGVKLFGLWNVSADNVDDFFPDVAGETAPDWRVESRDRIIASIATRR